MSSWSPCTSRGRAGQFQIMEGGKRDGQREKEGKGVGGMLQEERKVGRKGGGKKDRREGEKVDGWVVGGREYTHMHKHSTLEAVKDWTKFLHYY